MYTVVTCFRQISVNNNLLLKSEFDCVNWILHFILMNMVTGNNNISMYDKKSCYLHSLYHKLMMKLRQL